MAASLRISRRQLLLALGALVLVVVVVFAVIALRSDTDPVAGATTSASPTASSGAGAEPSPGEDDQREDDPAGVEPSEPSQGGDGDEPDPADDEAAAPEARETLDPAPFGAEATPEPGITVAVPNVEKVTGEANVPGEVGGPALRFTVDVTNGTGKTLDLRTVVVNAYYGPDRTPASPLLKPGGKAFAPEVDDADIARGVFVFNVPAEFQDEVELEIDPRIDAPIVIFTGASGT